MKAKSHWVWTLKAERDSRGRRQAGTRIDDMWQPDVPEWMVEQGLVVDAEDYDYGDGQIDLFEMI